MSKPPKSIRCKVIALTIVVFTLPTSSMAATTYGAFAVGVPYENIGAIADAGAVNIINGSAQGLSSDNNQLWWQGEDGIIDSAEAGDTFGSALASGDFDNDGYPDLAVGVPEESIGGAVSIIYGSKQGLNSSENQLWSQDSPDISGQTEADDRFGAALASGDFNNDGFADLAVGVPDEDIGLVADAGAVNILYGSAQGLASANNQLWWQGKDGISDSAEEYDLFGGSLTAGDFNNDGFTDLAVGVSSENDAVANVGAVHILYGSEAGLSSDTTQMWWQGKGGIVDSAEFGDAFGACLTSGDFNNDGFADLAIGAPFEDLGGVNQAGSVNIIYGSAQGLSSVGNQLWWQGAADIAGTPELDDYFGSALTSSDFNNDGFADIAIGVRHEAIGAITTAGAVNIIYGSVQGLSSDGNQMWYQGYKGIVETAESGDGFGRSLAAGDVNNDGFADLAIGVKDENINGVPDTGVFHVIYGSAQGLTSDNNQLWYQGTAGIKGTAETIDKFGWSLVFLPPGYSFPWSTFLPAMLGGE